MGITTIIKLTLIVVAIALLGGFIYHYSQLKVAIEIYKQNEITLKESIAEQQEVIAKMEADIESIKSINAEIRQQESAIRNELTSLETKFKRNKAGDVRDLGFLASQRPETVESMVNRATLNVARCFEISMGAPLTKEELEATTSDKINRECPRLANPNYVKVN